MDHIAAVVAEEGYFGVVEPKGVCADEERLGFVENAQTVEPDNGGDAILAYAVVTFGLCFRNMNMERQATFVREVGQILEVLGVDSIDGMRCNGEGDVVAALLLEAIEAREDLFELAFGAEVVVGDGERDVAFHTGLADGTDGLVDVEIHVVEGESARCAHFGACLSHTLKDIVGRKLRFAGKDDFV